MLHCRVQRGARGRGDWRAPEHEVMDPSGQVLQLDEVHAGRHAPVDEVLFGVRVVAQDPNGVAGPNALGLISENKNRLWAAETSQVDYPAVRFRGHQDSPRTLAASTHRTRSRRPSTGPLVPSYSGRLGFCDDVSPVTQGRDEAAPGAC